MFPAMVREVAAIDEVEMIGATELASIRPRTWPRGSASFCDTSPTGCQG